MFWDNENRKKSKQLEGAIAENQKLYRQVFDTPEGQAVLKDLEKRCFVNQTTFNANHGQMSFNEGRRSVYAYIINLINKDLQGILEELTKE